MANTKVVATKKEELAAPVAAQGLRYQQKISKSQDSMLYKGHRKLMVTREPSLLIVPTQSCPQQEHFQ